MLAAPLQSTSAFNDHSPDLGTQYRPAKDLQAFNALLPPAIEFVKGSSTGTIAPADGKYQPINAPKDVDKSEAPESKAASQPGSSKQAKQAKQAQASASSHTTKKLYTRPIEMTWPVKPGRGAGLVNVGNSCFLNSALQCLLHTPPLLRVLTLHGHGDSCNVTGHAFCMSCRMREVAIESFSGKRVIAPHPITKSLHLIAKTMRKYRQEDSHEFLRYAIDAMQKSCLAGLPPKVDPKLAETTWVHKIFGGKLRSRVTCLACGYNSDTYDSILDLSIDIYGVTNLRDALRKFVAVDHLRGADKYKCEKCKKAVSADKQFTVHEAPMVLTVHLKRFSPMGRKIGHLIKYDERLSLQPVMSEGQHGPTYSLYGVISHAGGGPSSGHYYAHVKDGSGQWVEMNDETVSRQSGAPLAMKNAYILFYIREKGQALEAVVAAPKPAPQPPLKTGLVAGMKKRKVVESEEEDDAARPASPKQRRFIGPLLPSAPIVSSRPDPQAETLKRKISEKQTASSSSAASPTKRPNALLELSQYSDDDEDDDVGERVGSDKPLPALPQTPTAPSTSDAPTAPESPSTPAPRRSTPTPSVTPTSHAPISTQSFYGSAKSSGKKRRQQEQQKHSSPTAQYARSPLKHGKPRWLGKGKNPFNRMTGGSNLGSPKKRKSLGKR